MNILYILYIFPFFPPFKDLPGNISSVNGMLEETKRIAESAKEAEDNQRNNNCGSNQNINVESGQRRVLKAKRFRED